MKIIANICLQLTLFSLLILTFSCEQFKNKSNNSARSRSVSEIDSSISAQQFETNESSFDYNSPFLKGLT